MDTVDRMIATMRSAFAAMAGGGARWADDDGVGALVTPAVPQRSVFNSVIYERGADVGGAYERLAALYAGEDASVLGIHDCGGDAGVFFVATRPAARGRGRTTRLLGHALAEARERGCDISTLQATRAGEPVYARLGYRTIGRIGMWEK